MGDIGGGLKADLGARGIFLISSCADLVESIGQNQGMGVVFALFGLHETSGEALRCP